MLLLIMAGAGSALKLGSEIAHRTESTLRDRYFTYKELFFSVVFLQEPLIIILLKMYDRVDRCLELMNLPKNLT